MFFPESYSFDRFHLKGRSFFLFLKRAWQKNREAGAFTGFGGNLDIAALQGDNLPGEVKANTNAFFLADCGGTVEAAENLGYFVFENTNSSV